MNDFDEVFTNLTVSVFVVLFLFSLLVATL
jgi:hypothetical protein